MVLFFLPATYGHHENHTSIPHRIVFLLHNLSFHSKNFYFNYEEHKNKVILFVRHLKYVNYESQ